MNGPDLSNFTVTFEDDFTTLSVSNSATNDGSRWYAINQPGSMSAPTPNSGVTGAYLYPGLGANNLALGLTSPIQLIPGGGLDLQMGVQTATNPPYNVPSWVGCSVSTVALDGIGFSQQYGYFEISAKFDPASGTWPAFWLLPVETVGGGVGGGEIDIFEHYGQFANNINTTLHDWSHNVTKAAGNFAANVALSEAFHKYGMLWNPQTITVYLDDVQIFQANTPAQMQQPYYILLDHGEGGGWPQPTSNGPFHYEVSYVKVWQQNGVVNTSSNSTTNSTSNTTTSNTTSSNTTSNTTTSNTSSNTTSNTSTSNTGNTSTSNSNPISNTGVNPVGPLFIDTGTGNLYVVGANGAWNLVYTISGTAANTANTTPPPAENAIEVATNIPGTVAAGSNTFPVTINMITVPTPGNYNVYLRLLDVNDSWVPSYSNEFPLPMGATSATANATFSWTVNVTFPNPLVAGTYTLTAGYGYYDGANWNWAPMIEGSGVTPTPEIGRTNEYVIGHVFVQ